MKFYILIFATIAVINQIQVEAFFLDAIFYKTKPLCEFICSNGSSK